MSGINLTIPSKLDDIASSVSQTMKNKLSLSKKVVLKRLASTIDDE